MTRFGIVRVPRKMYRSGMTNATAEMSSHLAAFLYWLSMNASTIRGVVYASTTAMARSMPR